MQNNIERDSSKLRLSNGSSKNNADVQVDPMSGNFVTTGKTYSGTMTISSVNIDYREQFENKREALHDMVKDGDGFTREEIYDLVRDANLAVWQESKDA